jgi:hypothetical protein
MLREQHAAGRKLTDFVLEAAKRAGSSSGQDKAKLANALPGFTRIYEAHAAREQTALFPAFHALFNEHEFDALGEQFEKQENRLLGAGGFESADKQALGIYELSQFTRRISPDPAASCSSGRNRWRYESCRLTWRIAVVKQMAWFVSAPSRSHS